VREARTSVVPDAERQRKVKAKALVWTLVLESGAGP
jgi:hypothetical protein